jgi:hypothetical protein
MTTQIHVHAVVWWALRRLALYVEEVVLVEMTRKDAIVFRPASVKTY